MDTGVTRRPSYPLVQALRAAAALVVAVHHVTYDAVSFGAGGGRLAAAIGHTMPWQAGVDVFFVISGFVMLHASEPLFGRGTAGIRIFGARRIARIVPLYWTATTLFLVAAATDPHAVHAMLGGAGYILASYAFVPIARPDGLYQPAFGLGWTLNYEMFFYLWFAVCLWLPSRRAVFALTAIPIGLVALVGLGGVADGPLAFWGSPIILEFMLGVWIRALLPRVGPLPGRLRFGMVVLAIAAFRADGTTIGLPEVLAWGFPAALLALAAVTGPEQPLSRWTAGWVKLGDASYALYLLHPFVLRVLSLCWRRAGWNSSGATLVYIGVCLGLTCLVALAAHVVLEVPATRAVRRWLEPDQATRRPAPVPLVTRG